MKTEDILQLIKNGEGLHVEFKESRWQLPGNLFETICAFLNTKGGILLLGVKDSGKIVGINPDELNKESFEKIIKNE